MNVLLEDAHHHGDGTLWDNYISIMSDPAHVLAELTFTALDILILSPLLFIIWQIVKRWFHNQIHKEHTRIDTEHGHEPHGCGDTTHDSH